MICPHGLATKKSCLTCKRSYSKSWHLKNRERHSARTRAWYRANKDRRKDLRLQQRYGISLEQYQEMLEAQEGRCWICADMPDKLHVDHNHRTGKVRKLLCNRCNLGIGYFADNPELFASAAEYIRNHP